jgi:MFS family permease
MKLCSWWKNPVNKIYTYSFFKMFAFFSAVLVPFFTEWGHITLFQVQLLQSWFSVWVFALEIPTGAIADKIGRKHSITLGSFTIAIATMVYGSIPSFPIFLLAEFLFALGYALNSGADQALLYDTLKSKGQESSSKHAFGRADSLMLAGMMIAAPIGSYLASKFGLNAPQYFTAIPMFFAAAIAWSIPEPRIHSDSETKKYWEILRHGFSSIRHHKVIRTLAVDSVVVASAAYFVVWFYQPLMTNLGIPIQYFGLVHAGLLFSEIIVSSNFSFFEKFLGRGKSYLRSSAVLVSLVFILVALIPNPFTLAIFIMLGAGIGYTRSTYVTALAQKYIDSAHRATTLSSIGMVRRFALVLLNPIIGYVATHSLAYALLLVSVLPLTSILIKEEV